VLFRSEEVVNCLEMDDDTPVLNYIEIVPLDNNAEQTEDLKPLQVKVCIVT